MKWVALIMILSLSACATRSVKVMDASWVSMKHARSPQNIAALKSVGTIEERFCQESWSGSYGLMDEVVKLAEKKHGIDYIRNASFTKEVGHQCATVVGEGFRIDDKVTR